MDKRKNKTKEELAEELQLKSYESQLKKQELEVRELEVKARYWKAQYDIRFYTLEAEKLQGSYDAYLVARREKEEEMIKRFQQEMENQSTASKEYMDNNPDLTDAGVKVGDDVGIPMVD